MATREITALLTSKAQDGVLQLLYPITKVENIEDLDVATHTSSGLLSAEDKIKIDNLSDKIVETSVGTFGHDGNGWYVEVVE